MGRANGRVVDVEQLSLRVESREELPVRGLLRVSGAMRVPRDVEKDAVLRVVVVDVASGEQIAECVADVQSVKLTTKRPESGPYVERLHACVVSSA